MILSVSGFCVRGEARGGRGRRHLCIYCLRRGAPPRHRAIRAGRHPTPPVIFLCMYQHGRQPPFQIPRRTALPFAHPSNPPHPQPGLVTFLSLFFHAYLGIYLRGQAGACDSGRPAGPAGVARPYVRAHLPRKGYIGRTGRRAPDMWTVYICTPPSSSIRVCLLFCLCLYFRFPRASTVSRPETRRKCTLWCAARVCRAAPRGVCT